MQGLFYPESVASYQQIMDWKEQQEELSEEQKQKTADYLTLKKQVEQKWTSEDKKRFLKVKKILKTQNTVIHRAEEVEA